MNAQEPTVRQRRKILLTKIFKIAIPTIITVGLCFVLFTGIDFDEMMAVIRNDCDFRWIVLGMALSIVAQVVRAWRWKLQLNALNIYPPFLCIVLSIFGTYAVNIVFPRLGELWRTGYIANRQHAPFTEVFGSMIADRVADLLLVAVLALVTFACASPAIMAFIERYPDAYNALNSIISSPYTWCAAVVAVAFFWWLSLRLSHRSFMIKIKKILRGLWTGFAVVVSMPHRFLWIVLSLALWTCYFMQLYVAFFAFPFTTALLEQNGLICALVCFVLSSMAMGIPSNGGIGPWQIAVVFALSLYAPGGLSSLESEMMRTNFTAFANLVMGMETLLLIVLGIFTFICIFFDRRRKPVKNATISPC